MTITVLIVKQNATYTSFQCETWAEAKSRVAKMAADHFYGTSEIDPVFISDNESPMEQTTVGAILRELASSTTRS